MKSSKSRGGVVPQEYEMVPVAALEPHPRNCNDSDLGAIIESIEHNRFFGAVLAQKSTGRIVAGKHRWLAAKERGLEVVPVIWLDVDDTEALRIMLADNRMCRLGHDDPQSLAELLQSLAMDTGTLAGTGFDGDDLDNLLADLTTGAVGGQQDEASGSPGMKTCPSCGYEF